MEFEFIRHAPKKTIYINVSKVSKFTPIDNERLQVRKLNKKLKALLSKFFKDNKAEVIKKLSKLLPTEKASSKGIKDSVDDVLYGMGWEALVPDVGVVLGAMSLDGATEALDQVGATADVLGPTTKWAEKRSAELVGMKYVDGELVPNPNAKWAITDSTRDMLRDMVAGAIDEGMSTDEFASYLEDSFAFSSGRAEMIARTELAIADTAGQVDGWAASGMVQGTIWTTAEDDKVSDECQMNADAGVVAMGDVYPSGDTSPPAHPNCRCALVPVIDEES